MSKQIVFHALAVPIPRAQADEVAKAAKAVSNADVYWVGAWVQNDDKGNVARIVCEWDAKDAESLKQVLGQMGEKFPGFPVDGPYPMEKVESESYR